MSDKDEDDEQGHGASQTGGFSKYVKGFDFILSRALPSSANKPCMASNAMFMSLSKS